MVQELLSIKEADELEYIKKAAGFSCYLQSKLIEHIEKIIDENLKEKHEKIS
jgi:hypothetical protein